MRILLSSTRISWASLLLFLSSAFLMQFVGQSMSIVCYRSLMRTEFIFLSTCENKIQDYALGVVAPEKLQNAQFSFIFLTL